MVDDVQVIQDFLVHAENFIEKPHPVFGGLAVCPFARTIRLENKFVFLVLPALGSSEDELLALAEQFAGQNAKEVLLVLYKDRDIPCATLYQYITLINQRLAPWSSKRSADIRRTISTSRVFILAGGRGPISRSSSVPWRKRARNPCGARVIMPTGRRSN